MKILVTYRAIDNTAGGVERMSTLIMNDMIRRGHSVDFATLDHQYATSFYKIDDKIIWHRLGLGDPSKPAGFSMRIKRIRAIRHLIKQIEPDVILAFQEASFLTSRLAAIGLDTPVVAAERNSPSRFSFMGGFKKRLALNSFKYAKFVTVQCERFKQYYPSSIRNKIVTIPNPVFPVTPSGQPRKKTILSIGRLEYQKNFPVLIKAFAKIADRFPEWSLLIVGDGADRTKLMNDIRAKKLTGRVFMHSSTSDMSSYYQTSSVFCLPSRWEGFPNVLAEALANGMPAIGFADCDGVNELIQDGRNGFLAQGNDNADSLASSFDALLKNEKLRDEMAENAILSVQAYEPSHILDQWESLLIRAAGE